MASISAVVRPGLERVRVGGVFELRQGRELGGGADRMRTEANRENEGRRDRWGSWEKWDGWGARPLQGPRWGAKTMVAKNCQRLLTRCLTSNTVCLTNPSRLSLDRRTRTGALCTGGRA